MSGSGEISVDTDAMSKYAKQQAAEVQKGFVNPMKSLDGLHRTEIPSPGNFPELAAFLAVRRSIQGETHTNILTLGDGSSILATGAARVAKSYRGTDSEAQTTVDGVGDMTVTVAVDADPAFGFSNESSREVTP